MANITTAWTEVAKKQTTVGAMTITFYIEARVTSQDTANNKTTREIRFRSDVNSGSGSGSDYEFTCTGCTSKSGSAVWYFGDETILSGSGTITHNSDGTKSETLTATADCYIFPSKITLSGTATYPTIARQSAVSVSPASLTIGSTAGTIAINSASSGFTHKIEILTGGTVRETFTGISNSKTWTPSAATYNRLIPNAKSITATIRCTTYSGSTQIGSQTTTTCTLNVNTSTYAPTTNPTATGSTTPILNGKTNVTIAGKVTIPTNSFATASSASIKVGNTTTALTLSSGNYSYTINKTTVSSATVTVTDSRGVSSSKTVSWNLVPYVPLTVGGSVSRPDAVGNSIVLTVSGNYYTGSDYANTLTVKATYNTTGTAQTVTITPTVSGTKYSGSVTLTGFDYTQTYSITVTATDKQGTVTATVTVPVSAPVWSAGNKGGVNHFDVHGNLRVVQQSDPTQGLLLTDQTGSVYAKGNISNDGWMFTKQDMHAEHGFYSYRATYSGGNTASGCVRFAKVKITSTNTNGPLMILISPRGMSPTWLTVRFNNSGVDPVLDDCMTRGGNVICGIRKTATSTWDLYCQTGGSYQNIVFEVVASTILYQGATLTWDNTVSTSWPSDIVYATRGTITPMGTGNVNTANGSLNGQLVIKSASASADGTPNNGIVFEFGNSTTWRGQLFFADNGSDGLWVSGWYNGTHQTWRRLVEADNRLAQTGMAVYNNRCSINGGGYTKQGNIVLFHMDLQIKTSLAANNWFTLLTGLPKPQNIAALSASGYELQGTYNAYVTTAGALIVNIGSLGLSNGNHLIIGGFYFIA